MYKARLLLADDHEDSAALLRGILITEFDVVGQVGDGRALVMESERLAPDVIVSDFLMPRMNGIEAAGAILRAHPEARIVLVTVHCDAVLAARSFETGVLGYVLKRAAGDELIPAIHSALRGERHISPLLNLGVMKTR